jgi:peptidyl-prolyl cis-trans isomerase B (cyclophilin B)
MSKPIISLILGVLILCSSSALGQSRDLQVAIDAATSTPEIKDNPMVIIHTNFGPIEVELYADKAPKSVENFLAYVASGHYENTLFHRVIPNFMIQGGGFDLNFQQKPTEAPIENEANNGLSNTRGTLAMARTMSPHSATSQFFINVQDNTFLDHQGTYSGQAWGYAVFGEVTQGMDVVDAIRLVQTGRRSGHQDVPVESVIIERMEVAEGS